MARPTSNRRDDRDYSPMTPMDIEAAVGVTGKLPPQNVEAEASLLGSLLIDKEAIIRIADIVTAEDFYVDRNNLVFSAIVDLYEQRSPIDLVTITNKLREVGELDRVGGSAYIAELTSAVPTAAHVVHYAQIVAHKATLRRLIA